MSAVLYDKRFLRIQLALLTGAFGVSGCWLLARTLLPLSAPERGLGGEVFRLLRRPPLLALVVICGFRGWEL